MKKKFFYVLLFLFITGCNKTNVVNQPLLNFSDEKSSNNLAEIYTFPDGTKVYSEFANIEFVISDERVDLYDGFKLGKITIDEIISKMTYKDSANDGGSKIYYFEVGDNDLADRDFTLVQCHKIISIEDEILKYNTDIIIGTNQNIIGKCGF